MAGSFNLRATCARALSRTGVFVAFAGAMLLWSGAAEAASFDCKKAASRIEHLICDTPDLNSYDTQLEGAYRGALDRSNTPEQVKAKQLAWLKQRDACADKKCLSAAYQRQIQLLSAISDEPAVCAGSTTLEINACMGEYSERAERELARYLAVARKRLTDEAEDGYSDPQTVKATLAEFDASQVAWEAYRKAECGAVYSWWSSGTIRGAMHQGCWGSLTHDRTQTIWSSWLQFVDSTPPLMPDPSKEP